MTQAANSARPSGPSHVPHRHRYLVALIYHRIRCRGGSQDEAYQQALQVFVRQNPRLNRAEAAWLVSDLAIQLECGCLARG